jgi:hypothetical protein
MGAETLDNRRTTAGSGAGSRPSHRLLTPPAGYVLGIGLWPAFVSLLAVWAVLLQSGLPSVVETVGGLTVGVGGFVVTSVGSALVLGVTAWNTPTERIRRQVTVLGPSLLLAGLLFGLYRTWPMLPYRDELGASAFVAHEVSKIVFLGPAIGVAFLAVPLAVLVYRTSRE